MPRPGERDEAMAPAVVTQVAASPGRSGREKGGKWQPGRNGGEKVGANEGGMGDGKA